MPKKSKYETHIRERLNEIEAELAGKRQALAKLEDEKGILEGVLLTVVGKEDAE